MINQLNRVLLNTHVFTYAKKYDQSGKCMKRLPENFKELIYNVFIKCGNPSLKFSYRAGIIAHWLTALTALVKDLGS